jgi:hypothetical protein
MNIVCKIMAVNYMLSLLRICDHFSVTVYKVFT